MTNQMYLAEYQILEGEVYITFNIVYLNSKKREVQVAVTNRGKITIVTYDLYYTEKDFYFEYGCDYTKVYIKDFKEIKE